MRRGFAVAAAVVLASSAFAQPDAPAPYVREDRVAHIDAALAAFATLGPDGTRALEAAIYQDIRTRCKPSGTEAPIVGCLEAFASAACAARFDLTGCSAAADVIVTNLHAENALVPDTTRMRLVAAGADYHGAMLREMRSRQALLASELALATPGAAATGARIDRFCAERDRDGVTCEPGAKLCVGSLPWQRCVAGLVWYVSTPEEKEP
jgi:hypothetical protein